MPTRISCLLAFCLFCQAQLSAQKSFDVKGSLTDIEKIPLIAATVISTNLSDSSFADYGLRTEDGQFVRKSHELKY